jgi:death-on-curing family protein
MRLGMKYLEVEYIIEINEAIYQESIKDDEIEYSGKDEYPIKLDKIESLIEKAPKESIIDTASYYMKNIILLQPFPNGNHRTAILAAEYFLQINGNKLEYSKDEITKFHKNSFNVQFKTYKTYEELNTKILTEEKNEFYYYCKKFIEDHLTKGD